MVCQRSRCSLVTPYKNSASQTERDSVTEWNAILTGHVNDVETHRRNCVCIHSPRKHTQTRRIAVRRTWGGPVYRRGSQEHEPDSLRTCRAGLWNLFRAASYVSRQARGFMATATATGFHFFNRRVALSAMVSAFVFEKATGEARLSGCLRVLLPRLGYRRAAVADGWN